MCGVFGFTGNIPATTRVTLARSLAIANTARGDHSTGLANIAPDRSVQLWKDTLPPMEAAVVAEFGELASMPGTCIGHTRWATTGAVTRDNAHPWQIGRTVGAHNGCASIVSNRLRERCEGTEYPVDSQYLLHLIDAQGTIGELSGSAVLTYCRLWDTPDVSLVRWCNPLSIGAIGDDAIVWSSERAHLDTAMAIAGIADWDIVTCADDTRIDAISHRGKLHLSADDSGIWHAPRIDGWAWQDDEYRDSRHSAYTRAWREYTADDAHDEDVDADFWRLMREYV